MNSWSRLLVMFAAVALTAAVVVALKGMFAGDAAPPAFLSGASNSPPAEPPEVGQQPTILQAKPAIGVGPDGTLSGTGYNDWTPDDRSGYSMPQEDGPYPGNPSANPRLLDRPTPSSDEPHWQHGPAPRLETRPSQDPDVAQPALWPPEVNPVPESAAPARQVYTARANDSLWSISEDLYGSGGFYIALYLHNRDKVPDPARLVPGVSLATPTAAVLRRLYPQHCPSE